MKILAVSALLSLPLLLACTGVQKRESGEEMEHLYMAYAGQPISGFSNIAGLNSWRAVDRNKLIVWKGVNEAYLLTVDSFCRNLQFAEHVGVTTTAGSTVQSGFDYVLYRDGVQNERCRITEIRPFDAKRMRRDTRKRDEDEEEEE